MNPFSKTYDNEEERTLVQEAQEGSRVALEKLITLHQRFIYNIALKLVRNPDDAADLAQEALIKMITKLNQFKGKSSFRTWLYKIVVNHFIRANQRKAERETDSFEKYGDFLDNTYDKEEMTMEEHHAYQQEIINVRDRCMTSMLLCLDRQQRLVFILGAIFRIRSNKAAPLLDMTAMNFRQQLSRAKADLFQFMDNKCGLIDPRNPCRCAKKTKGFIKDGIIDPSGPEPHFKAAAIQEIRNIAPAGNARLDDLMEDKYLDFFQAQPYADEDFVKQLLQTLLFNKDITDLFKLN